MNKQTKRKKNSIAKKKTSWYWRFWFGILLVSFNFGDSIFGWAGLFMGKMCLLWWNALVFRVSDLILIPPVVYSTLPVCFWPFHGVTITAISSLILYRAFGVHRLLFLFIRLLEDELSLDTWEITSTGYIVLCALCRVMWTKVVYTMCSVNTYYNCIY